MKIEEKDGKARFLVNGYCELEIPVETDIRRWIYIRRAATAANNLGWSLQGDVGIILLWCAERSVEVERKLEALDLRPGETVNVERLGIGWAGRTFISCPGPEYRTYVIGFSDGGSPMSCRTTPEILSIVSRTRVGKAGVLFQEMCRSKSRIYG